MPEIIDILIQFEKWCPKCEHYPKDGYKDPCNECLENSVNQNSEKPVKFAQKS